MKIDVKNLSQEQLQALALASATGSLMFVGSAYILRAMKEPEPEPDPTTSDSDRKKYERRRLLDAFVNWSEVEKGWGRLTRAFNPESGGGGR